MNEMMQAAIGFTVIRHNDDERFEAAIAAQTRALSHFSDLDQFSIQIGVTRLFVWGRKNLKETLYSMADGSVLLRVGSPIGVSNWDSIAKSLSQSSKSEEYQPPWDGRYVLLKISPDGRQWVMWNDWLGSIPVFHFGTPESTIASTLEPVVVAGAGLGSDDIFLPSVLSLLIHGNYISDWSLFRQMKVVRPDTVSTWEDQGFSFVILETVSPSDANWDKGWNELREQMYELSTQSITEVLKSHSSWVLPLSGGLDSRLIAAIGANLDVDLSAFTWGSRNSRDAIYAQSLARELGIPWKLVDFDSNYLEDYTNVWVDLFGSAMHFHGMYQMPFLDALDSQDKLGPVVSGFLGEGLAGYDVQFQSELHSGEDLLYQEVPDGYLHWTVEEVRSLLKIPTDEAFEELGAEIKKQIDILDGPRFRGLRFLTLWGRQHYFTYFQSMLSDYWRGVATPFLNRDYGNFCLSLPRAALDERRLQRDMFAYYLGSAARIPVSYDQAPMINNGPFLLRKRLARILPDSLLRGPLREFRPSDLSLDGVCVQNGGIEVLWPLLDAWNVLDGWLDMDILEKVVTRASRGDVRAVRKLQSVQTLAFRLLETP